MVGVTSENVMVDLLRQPFEFMANFECEHRSIMAVLAVGINFKVSTFNEPGDKMDCFSIAYTIWNMNANASQ